jgi:hypothetical protein
MPPDGQKSNWTLAWRTILHEEKQAIAAVIIRAPEAETALGGGVSLMLDG